MKQEKFEKILSVEMTYQLSKLCFMMGAALLMFTFAAGLGGCKSNVSNGTKTNNTEIEAGVSSVEGGVSMLLSPEARTIEIRVLTSDGSAINVEGCSGSIIDGGDFSKSRTLTAKGERIVLKGKITKLLCDNNQLTSLNVQGCSELEWLYCWQNQLTSLDVHSLTALTELECYGNQLTKLNVQGCSALNKLNCYSNQLTSLDVQSLKALTELNCGFNKLSSLDVHGLNALEKLNCIGNQLTSLNVHGCSALNDMSAGVNKLTTLDVHGLTALTYLSCHENELTKLNVQGCSALENLSCGDNQLTSLDVNALNALEELYCYANQLTSLNVQGCSALSNMDCRSNKLGSSAFIKLFDDLPASGGECYIYLDDKSEGNHKNFNAPEKLKQAFNKAKTEKNWTMYKYEEDWSQTKI